MKNLSNIVIIATLLWCSVSNNVADLPDYNDRTTGTINLGNVVVRTNITASGVVATNSLTLGSTAFSTVTGSGSLVGGTSPIFNTSLTLTNPTTGIIAMVINQASGGTATNFISLNLGGTNWMYFDQSGQIFGRSSTTGPGALMKFTDTGNIAVTRFDVPTRNYVTLGFSPGVGLTSFGQVSWSNSSTDSTSAETILTRDSQNVIQIGTDGINVLTYAMKAGDGSGTDKGGSHYATKGGQSTGSGPPGDLIYQTSLYTNSSGSTANLYTTRGQVVGRPCALTNATATSFQRFTMATNTQAGINIFATVKATDAAFARQSISSYVRVDAVNVNGTITATVSETDNTLAASTGTLTIAYTVVDEGSNVLAIRANANTSLTATPSIKWIITGINSDGAITVTPVQL